MARPFLRSRFRTLVLLGAEYSSGHIPPLNCVLLSRLDPHLLQWKLSMQLLTRCLNSLDSHLTCSVADDRANRIAMSEN